MRNITLDTSEKFNGFIIKNGERSIRIEFLSAPVDSYLYNDDTSVSFMARKDVRASSYIEAENTIACALTRETVYPSICSIKITGFDKINPDKDCLKIELDDSVITAKISDGYFDVNEYGQGVLHLTGTLVIIKFNLNSSFNFKSEISSFSLDIPQSYSPLDRAPEFSIGIFDGYNPDTKAFLRPRQLRFGVPVISTLPTQGDDLTQDEIDFLNAGSPPKSRTMHFRIICSSLIETGLTEGDLSQLKLKLQLPSGLDTVAPAVDVPMYFLGTDIDFGIGGSEPSQLIYRASYSFNREDTINYVDGFMYLSVFVPIAVQSGLPVVFRVSGTGSPSPEPDDMAAIFSATQKTNISDSNKQVDASSESKINKKKNSRKKNKNN